MGNIRNTAEFVTRLRRLMQDIVQGQAEATRETAELHLGGVSCIGYAKGTVVWRRAGDRDITKKLHKDEVLAILTAFVRDVQQ